MSKNFCVSACVLAHFWSQIDDGDKQNLAKIYVILIAQFSLGTICWKILNFKSNITIFFEF